MPDFSSSFDVISGEVWNLGTGSSGSVLKPTVHRLLHYHHYFLSSPVLHLLQQLGFSFNLIVIPTLLTEGQREDVQEKREYYGGS